MSKNLLADSPQLRTPLADALERMLRDDYLPFDVPGHKANISRLTDFFGERCLSLDLNSRQAIDNLNQPDGVIAEAEALAAEAFGAKHAFFLVGGTTSAVQAMIMSTCSQGDKIILPRNVHVSVMNAVILSGAVPVYLNPGIHEKLGISLGTNTRDIENCIKANTDAKAVFVNNPTYYGICSDLKEIVRISHEYGIPVLVDEAHGTHFYFSKQLPPSAMECGADMAAVSMHKTGGSLTQSSMLLTGNNVDTEHVKSIVNLSCTTSASYLLLSSLDLARHNLVLCGEKEQDRVISLADYARKCINEIYGYYSFADDIIDNNFVYDFDKTKLCINSTHLGLAGIELYNILRDKYKVQVEFGDVNNILAIVSLGDSLESVQRLINVLAEIAESNTADEFLQFRYEYIEPVIKLSPRKAYYMQYESVLLDDCLGRISRDFIMCYPPGVPLLAPGELITDKVLSHIKYASQKGCRITGLSADKTNSIKVVI